ncbi:hypothetical protein RFI_15819, partial [Reticulomyxa filosa]
QVIATERLTTNFRVVSRRKIFGCACPNSREKYPIQIVAKKKKKASTKEWELLFNDSKFLKVVSNIRKTNSGSYYATNGDEIQFNDHSHKNTNANINLNIKINLNVNANENEKTKSTLISKVKSKIKSTSRSTPLDWAVFTFEQVRRGVKKMVVENCGSGGITALASCLKRINELRYCMLNFQYGHIAKRKKLLVIIWTGGQKMDQSGLIALFKHKKNIEEVLGVLCNPHYKHAVNNIIRVSKSLTISSSTRLKRSMILSQLAREGLLSEILIRVVIQRDGNEDDDDDDENEEDDNDEEEKEEEEDNGENRPDEEEDEKELIKIGMESDVEQSKEENKRETEDKGKEKKEETKECDSEDDYVTGEYNFLVPNTVSVRMDRSLSCPMDDTNSNSHLAKFEKPIETTHEIVEKTKKGMVHVYYADRNWTLQKLKESLSQHFHMQLQNLQVTLIPDTFKKQQFSKFNQVKTTKTERLLSEAHKTLHELDLVHGSLIYLSHQKQNISNKNIRVDRQKNLERIFCLDNNSLSSLNATRSLSYLYKKLPSRASTPHTGGCGGRLHSSSSLYSLRANSNDDMDDKVREDVQDCDNAEQRPFISSTPPPASNDKNFCVQSRPFNAKSLG